MRVAQGWRSALTGLAMVVAFTANGEATTTCTFTVDGSRMQLNGDCTTDATIYVPQGMTLDGRGYTITAVDPPGDHWRGAVIRNAGTEASVVSLTIATAGLVDICDFGPGPFGEDRLRGIALYGANGSIRNNRIFGLAQTPGSTCLEGTGILAETAPFDGTHPNPRRVDIRGNEIVGVQLSGIAVQGDVGATIDGNRVSLSDEVGPITQFAVGVTSGAFGNVERNTLRGGYRDGVAFLSSGVFVYEASQVRVVGNVVSSVSQGVVVRATCQRAPEASRNIVAANAIRGALEGIVVVAQTFAGVSQCDAHVDRNLVSFNAVLPADGVTALNGVFYGVQAFGGGFVPVADRNRVSSNLIVGYANPLVDSGSTNSVVSGNIIR